MTKETLAQQEQPASVDAYVGAREDAAIWKKRALEAEELNRKFIADVNGSTYLGEPVKQEQPAAVAYELEAVKFGNGKQLVYQKPKNLASYIKVRTLVYADADPAPTQPAQEPDPVLCKFYQVTTFEELVSAQEHHINKLQAKLEKENDNGMGSILARKSRAASDQWSGCAVVGCVASESQTGQVQARRAARAASQCRCLCRRTGGCCNLEKARTRG